MALFLGIALACGPARAQSANTFAVVQLDKAGSLILPTIATMGGATTIEGWVFLRSHSVKARLVELSAGGANNATHDLLLIPSGLPDSPGRPYFQFNVGSSAGGSVSSSRPVPLLMWTHIAAVVNADSSMHLYMNGERVGSGTATTLPSSVSRNAGFIGKSNWSVDPLLDGSVADVRLWNVGRTQQEIAAAMAPGSIAGPATGLVAAYPFGTTGAEALSDVSGNNLHLTASGTVQYAQASLASNMRVSAGLNGSSWFAMPSLPAFGTAVTLEAWVYPKGSPNWGSIIDLGNGYPSDTITLNSSHAQSGAPYASVSSGATWTASVTSPSAIPQNIWSHLAVTVGSDRAVRLYVNGQLVASGTASAAIQSVSRRSNLVGRSNNGPTFDGSVSDVRIWSVARTQAEIQASMPVGSVTGAATGLVAAYPLGSTGSGVLADVSGNARHLAQVGPVSYTKQGAGTVSSTLSALGAFRYYRLVPTALRGGSGADAVQLAEFQMLFNGSRLAGATASNPGGVNNAGQGPQQANDNNLGTKWIDITKTSPLRLDFGSPTVASAYRFATADDVPNRDPISWRVEGSLDNAAWVVLDTRSNYAVTTSRNTYLDAISFPSSALGSSLAVSAGKLNLSGANLFTGGTVVDGGSLSLTGSISNHVNGSFTVSSGGVISVDQHDLIGGGGGHTGTPLNPIVVQAGGTFRNGINSATGGGFYNILGPVTLSGGTLLSVGSNPVAGTPGFSFSFKGQVNVNGGAATSTIDGPGFTLGSAAVTSTTFDVADGSAAVDLNVPGILGDGPNTAFSAVQASSLVKSGDGVMVLSGNNTYSGVTTISAGTLQVGNGGTAGSLGSGGVVNNGALVFNRSDNIASANAVGGTGSVTKNGAGTLTLSSIWSHAGGTDVSAGTLAITRGGGVGTLRGTVTVRAGAVLSLRASDALGFNAGEQVTDLNIDGGLVETTTAYQLYRIAHQLTAGELRANAGVSSATATSWFWMDQESSFTSMPSASPSVISGRGVLRDPGASIPFTVADGDAAIDFLVSAAITEWNANGGGGIRKAGPGTMVLSGNNTYSGPTDVTAGTLALTGSGSIDSSSSINVSSGATLDVTGRSSALALGTSKTLSNAGGTARLRGNIAVTTATLALSLDTLSPAFSVEAGDLSLGAGSSLSVTVVGSPLPEGLHKLVSKGAGGAVVGVVPPAVTLSGAGIASGLAAVPVLQNGELFLRVATPATVTLGNLAQRYDGSGRVVTATTDPAGLPVAITYNGSGTAPVDAGSYSIVASITDTAYSGSVTGTLVVSKGIPVITVGGLNQSFSGSARSIIATTDPAGLAWTATYNGSANAPTNIGIYNVIVAVSTANYAGFTNAVMTVKAGDPNSRPAPTPQPPSLLNHHGFLTDSSGTPLGSPNPRNHDVIFRIFSTATGGASLWAERQTVTMDQGEYDVMLGEGMSHGAEPWPTLDKVLAGGPGTSRFLEVTVRSLGVGGSDVVMSPRFLLPSQPYAFMAAHARVAESLLGANGAPVLNVSGNAVGIGVLQPNAALDVAGSMAATSLVNEGNTSVTGSFAAASFTGSGTIPVGGIVIWAGSASAVPPGYALCNGQAVAGRSTPDLRGRFILGHGHGNGLTSRPFGGVGGAESHVLQLNELGAHHHVFDPPAATSSSDGAHRHSYASHSANPGGRVLAENFITREERRTRTQHAGRSVSHNSHNHSLDVAAWSSRAGGGQPHPSMPPFYVLAYIMRVQ